MYLLLSQTGWLCFNYEELGSSKFFSLKQSTATWFQLIPHFQDRFFSTPKTTHIQYTHLDKMFVLQHIHYMFIRVNLAKINIIQTR